VVAVVSLARVGGEPEGSSRGCEGGRIVALWVDPPDGAEQLALQVLGRGSRPVVVLELSKNPITAVSVPSGSTIAVASRTASEIVGIVSRLPGFIGRTHTRLPTGQKPVYASGFVPGVS
jgi:hypothetical protein